MEANELIKLLKISIIKNYATGEKSLKIVKTNIPQDVSINDILAEVKDKKQEIIAELERQEEEKQRIEKENESHIHSFMVIGWEAHEVTIDDRKDVKAQCETIAKRYEYSDSSITSEKVEADYKKQLHLDSTKDEREAAADLKTAKEIMAKAEKQDDIPTPAEYRAWRKAYNDVNNEGGDGYIPSKVTTEDVEWAQKIINGAN